MNDAGKSYSYMDPERYYGMEIFLRVAAYRATHEGNGPPLNSGLWQEYARIHVPEGRKTRLLRLLGLRSAGEKPKDGPLILFNVEKTLLADDHLPEHVGARLECWPMIVGYRMVERHFTGEWSRYLIDVLAESEQHARRIVEYIFALERESVA